MSNVDLNQLANKSQELTTLINEANQFLDEGCQISTLGDDLLGAVGDLSDLSSGAKYAMAKALSRGRPRDILIGLAVFGSIYVGAKGIDVVRNGIAKKKVEKMRLGYYNELMAKNGMLIDAQQKLIEELDKAKNQSEDEAEQLSAKLDSLTKTIKRLSELTKAVKK